MTFAQAEQYLLGTIGESVSRSQPYRLERMRALVRELDAPQEAYPTIHVGGTSGKGSTATMIAAALRASGKRTGLHTKPHLTSVVERARIDDAPISQERFAAMLEQMMPAIERVARDYERPSYYETLLALAFTYFQQERVDVAVIEVGLGGRLDGTNVLRRPQVSVITTVGFDHMDVLGDTLEAIAAEKAGIAKPGVPLLCGVESVAARAVIERHAHETGTPVVLLDDVARVLDDGQEADGQAFTVATRRATYRLRTPVLGAFQRRNAATAVAALELLRDDLRPDAGAVARGFATLALPGRLDVIAGEPLVVFDIAHNAEKAASLVAALRERFPERTLRFVAGVGASKDASAIVGAFARVAAHIVATRFTAAGRPATEPADLTAMARAHGIASETVTDPQRALARALALAAPNDIVVVTGSTFIVGELRAVRV